MHIFLNCTILLRLYKIVQINKEKANANTIQENETPDDTESVDSKDVVESAENVIKPQNQSKSGGSKGNYTVLCVLNIELIPSFRS